MFIHLRFEKYLKNGNIVNSVSNLDTRAHELMLEAARYTVLFTAVFIYNLFMIMLSIICYVYGEKEYDKSWSYIESSILAFGLAGKEVFVSDFTKLV